jgi:hypothetical protein
MYAAPGRGVLDLPIGEGRTVRENPHPSEEQMPLSPILEEQVLAALERALAERQTEAAEHLLRALEALSGEASPGSVLADAYRTATRERGPERSRH